MKLKSFLGIMTLLLLGGSVFSQDKNIELLNDKSTITSFDLREKGLQGSSYINEKWLPAEIPNNKTTYLMRYNAYRDIMEVNKDGTAYALTKNFNNVVTFIGINKVYEVYLYNNKGKTNLQYFVVLYKGKKIALLNKETVKFYEEVKPSTGYDKYQPPKLERLKDQLFIGYPNNTVTELPNRKKDILKLFSSNESKINTYIKQHHLSLKKTSDLIEIFKYFNTLM